MQRYTVETHDPYDMEPDSNGMWVMFDDVQAVLALAKTIAEWHVEDSDECGEVARSLLSLIEP